MTDEEREPGRWPLGPWLEEARGERSLDQIAEKSGISRATIRYYELGYRADNRKPAKARANVLRPLARALGVPVPEAFRLGGIENQLLPGDFDDSASVLELARRIGELDVLDREALTRIVDSLHAARGWKRSVDAPPSRGHAETAHGGARGGHPETRPRSPSGEDVPG